MGVDGSPPNAYTEVISRGAKMSSFSRRVLRGAGILLLLLGAGAAFAADLNPAALAYRSPDQLKWRGPTGAAGVKQAGARGGPEQPRLYGVHNRVNPGKFSRPP